MAHDQHPHPDKDVNNITVNGYLSNIIHDQKVMAQEKEHNDKNVHAGFHNEINDDLTKLDITV